MQGQSSFQIKTYVPTHNCGRIFYNRQVNSTWLSKKYLKTLKSNPSITIQSFKQAMQKDHKVGISKSQVYRTKRKAQELIEGSLMEQYAKLWDYYEKIKRTNLGTTIIVKEDDEESENEEHEIDEAKPRFQRIFVCFGGCKQGFLAGCRPFIGVDVYYLKGPYKGQLLQAVGLDGNNNSYPLAFAVVEGETKSSWKWFFEILCDTLGWFNKQGVTFMSDKQKVNASLVEVSPITAHRFCIRLLYTNFRDSFKGVHLKDIVYKATKASYVQAFEAHMEELKEADEDAFNWFVEKPPSTWPKSHFTPTIKSDILDNNMCESFNSLILEARGKTIIPLLEDIRCILMKRLQVRKEVMRAYTGPICPNIQQTLEKRKEDACNCIAMWARAIYDKHEQPKDYVAHWYKKETYLASYEPMIYLINGYEMWPKSVLPGLLPLKVKKQPGRPRKLRKRQADEPKNPHKLHGGNITTICSLRGDKQLIKHLEKQSATYST
ncbi:uncharacterized protein LOC114297512 [Camellia sinensis]|uniref:uncharacterized protein LOC114297512 n=1 Tax=Camellia sinensis TaxID=4442 RepID=UPI001035C807|nr:uncharacterized protein LOC114297512 [Camellia sinensis]